MRFLVVYYRIEQISRLNLAFAPVPSSSAVHTAIRLLSRPCRGWDTGSSRATASRSRDTASRRPLRAATRSGRALAASSRGRRWGPRAPSTLPAWPAAQAERSGATQTSSPTTARSGSTRRSREAGPLAEFCRCRCAVGPCAPGRSDCRAPGSGFGSRAEGAARAAAPAVHASSLPHVGSPACAGRLEAHDGAVAEPLPVLGLRRGRVGRQWRRGERHHSGHPWRLLFPVVARDPLHLEGAGSRGEAFCLPGLLQPGSGGSPLLQGGHVVGHRSRHLRSMLHGLQSSIPLLWQVCLPWCACSICLGRASCWRGVGPALHRSCATEACFSPHGVFAHNKVHGTAGCRGSS